MKTLKENIKNELTIKKSLFITYLYPINSKEEAVFKLNELRKEYYNANHICYGYIINDYKKCSDDKEPVKTAGIPILNVLDKNNLNNILAVVIRYFGGILLGTGGLIRAYSSSVIEALKFSTLIPIIEYKEVIIMFDYNKLKQVDNILKNYHIEKEFGLNIIYKIFIPLNELDMIEQLLNNENIKLKK